MSKILHLPIKKKWFDMIASGEKKEEYREIKRHWIVRLLSNIEYLTDLEGVKNVGPRFLNYDYIQFTNGYGKNAPSMLVECLGIRIGEARPEWSDGWKGELFIISLGKIEAA